ncbi:hypothetical protein CDEST_07489 [Colletotrichum destructivum]|uniref:Uncharacterized protein n=1 Tax=Colletotrichum destructivum TaxID=34406 RepID=A0AAX4IGM2_9PEZI|nr:hypothetical protein CDEST_07489 [Colletotrichum destructivum]
MTGLVKAEEARDGRGTRKTQRPCRLHDGRSVQNTGVICGTPFTSRLAVLVLFAPDGVGVASAVFCIVHIGLGLDVICLDEDEEEEEDGRTYGR